MNIKVGDRVELSSPDGEEWAIHGEDFQKLLKGPSFVLVNDGPGRYGVYYPGMTRGHRDHPPQPYWYWYGEVRPYDPDGNY